MWLDLKTLKYGKFPKELFEGISPSFRRSQGRIGIDREFTMNR